MRFEAGQKLDTVELPVHAIDRLEDLPTDAADGVYRVGATSAPVPLSVTVEGDAPPLGKARAALTVSAWNHKPSEAVEKEMIVLAGGAHLGQAYFVDAQGRTFIDPGLHEGKPARGEVLSRQQGGLVAQSSIVVDQTIDGPVLFLGNATGQFGHFLLDMVSRFWAVEWALAQGMKIAFYSHKGRALDFHTTFFEAVGLKPEDLIVLSASQPMRFERLYMPMALYRLHRGAHRDLPALFGDVADRILAKAYPEGPPPGPERLYLSRRLWAKRRNLANEAEVEALLAARGFEIVFPEQLDLAEQIRFARSARDLAAPIGSQTYLSLFQKAPRDCLILAPTTFTFADDAIISGMRDVPTTFVLGAPLDPDSAGPRDHDFAVDLALVERLAAARYG